MRDDRTTHYRAVAARLRDMAGQTQFGDMRESYLNLAYQFDRLAQNVERSHAPPGDAAGGSAMLDRQLERHYGAPWTAWTAQDKS